MDSIVLTAENHNSSEKIDFRVVWYEKIEDGVKLECRDIVGKEESFFLTLSFSSEESKGNFIKTIGEVQCQK